MKLKLNYRAFLVIEKSAFLRNLRNTFWSAQRSHFPYISDNKDIWFSINMYLWYLSAYQDSH